MMTRNALLALAARQDGIRTLSAYIAVAADTPSPVTAARAQLRQNITRIREALATASHAERAEFEACAARLLVSVDRDVHKQGGGTWVGFSSADGTTYDEPLPGIVSTSVVWEPRMRVVPYLSICDDRGALVVVIDREHARFYRYALGILTMLEHIDTIPVAEPASESAARQAANTFHRHASRVLARLAALDRAGDWIVIGGAAESVAHIAAVAPRNTSGRLGITDRLTAASTLGEVRAAAADAMHALHCTAQDELVNDILAHRDGVTLDALGEESVGTAVERRAVAALVVSENWTQQHPAEAEDMVRRVLTLAGKIEIVSDHAATLLDHWAEGITARLRFAVVRACRGPCQRQVSAS